MILWSIQTIKAWEILSKKGIIYTDQRYIPNAFKEPYRWMSEQTESHIGNVPYKNAKPLWGWYQWSNNKKKKPDLRSSGLLSAGSKGVRIQIEINENEVLLSDFELWHFVLNYWYLPSPEEDENKFDHLIGTYSWTNPAPSYLHSKIVKSWNRIFNVNGKNSIQATLWNIKIEQVMDYKIFFAK